MGWFWSDFGRLAGVLECVAAAVGLGTSVGRLLGCPEVILRPEFGSKKSKKIEISGIVQHRSGMDLASVWEHLGAIFGLPRSFSMLQCAIGGGL